MEIDKVGERVKGRRTELNLTMPELGRRIGVNKSTIQRYEADSVDPRRTMIINGLAEFSYNKRYPALSSSQYTFYHAAVCRRFSGSVFAYP